MTVVLFEGFAPLGISGSLRLCSPESYRLQLLAIRRTNQVSLLLRPPLVLLPRDLLLFLSDKIIG